VAEIRLISRSATTASHVLGHKLDSIPFSPYHLMILVVLGLVGFIDGYDLVMTGSLLVLAKQPLHLSAGDVRFLAVASTMMICVGGFIASTISDHFSRKTIMLIGVGAITFFTLLIPLVQTGEQLIALRLLTGLGGGFAVSAPFPIAAELMPAQHRRTFGAIYEMSLAASFTVLPFVGFVLSGNPNAFRIMALPGGLAFLVVPALIYFLIPESPRWYLRRGRTAEALETVNRIIRRTGGRVPELAAASLGDHVQGVRERLPPYRALFGRGQLRWTAIGISSYVFCGTAFFSDLGAAAKGARRSGCGGQFELWRRLAGVCREHPGKGLHRVSDGGHRPALDDLLCDGGRASRSSLNDDGPSRRTTCDDRHGYRRIDHRLHRAFHRDRLPGLPFRTVPNGIAWPWTHLRRIGRAYLFWGDRTVFDGAAYRIPGDLFWHDHCSGHDRRVHPGAVRPRDRGSARNRYRGSAGARLR